MKKLSISILSIIFTFSLSVFFTSCGDDKDDANEAAEEMVEEANEANETAEAVETADYSAGEAIYKSKCMACHQENGEGVDPSFPALKGKAADINTVVNGKAGTAMVAFKDQLNDQELTDVINYVNHAWGNKYDEITVEDVAAEK